MEESQSTFYTPAEVAAHALPDDCWVSFNGWVYDLSLMLASAEGPLVQPIIKAAGCDISHWFTKTGELKSFVNPVTNIEQPYYPQGRFLHVPPAEPTADWDTSFGTPWWKEESYRVGKLAAATRAIRIKNVLTGQEHRLTVPEEETLNEIKLRYRSFNYHADSYIWKVLKPNECGQLVFTELDLEKNLTDNGLPDEADECEKFGVPEEGGIPVIHLYFADELTLA